MKCIARAYSFTCALLTYGLVQSQSYQTVKGFMTKCNVLHYYLIVQYLMQTTFCYDSTITTNDLNLDPHISFNSKSRKNVQYVFACYFDNFK